MVRHRRCGRLGDGWLASYGCVQVQRHCRALGGLSACSAAPSSTDGCSTYSALSLPVLRRHSAARALGLPVSPALQPQPPPSPDSPFYLATLALLLEVATASTASEAEGGAQHVPHTLAAWGRSLAPLESGRSGAWLEELHWLFPVDRLASDVVRGQWGWGCIWMRAAS